MPRPDLKPIGKIRQERRVRRETSLSKKRMKQKEKPMYNEKIYRAAVSWAQNRCWGISREDLEEFTNMHSTGDPGLCQYVEDILEDCNFHTIYELVHEQKYKQALMAYDETCGGNEDDDKKHVQP